VIPGLVLKERLDQSKAKNASKRRLPNALLRGNKKGSSAKSEKVRTLGERARRRGASNGGRRGGGGGFGGGGLQKKQNSPAQKEGKKKWVIKAHSPTKQRPVIIACVKKKGKLSRGTRGA